MENNSWQSKKVFNKTQSNYNILHPNHIKRSLYKSKLDIGHLNTFSHQRFSLFYWFPAFCINCSRTPSSIYLFKVNKRGVKYVQSLRGLEAKNSSLFLWHNFKDFMNKVFWCSHEIMKLQSFESGVSDVILTNAQNISSLVFFAYFLLILWKRNLYTVLWSTYEVAKFWMIDLCFNVRDVIHANEHT